MSWLHGLRFFSLLCVTVTLIPLIAGQKMTMAQRIQNMKETTRQKSAKLENSASSFGIVKATTQLIDKSGTAVASAINQTADGITHLADSTVSFLKNITVDSINKGADFFLNIFLKSLERNEKDVIDLPDIDTKFFSTTFKATGGYFKSLKTLRKTSDAQFSAVNNTVLVEIPLAMSDIEAGYSSFKLRAWPLSVSGSFNAQVDENEFNVRMILQTDKDCAVNVERMELTKLSGLTINFVGICRLCSSVVSSVSTALANLLQESIMHTVQTQIDELMAFKVELFNKGVIIASSVGTYYPKGSPSPSEFYTFNIVDNLRHQRRQCQKIDRLEARLGVTLFYPGDHKLNSWWSHNKYNVNS